MRHLTLLDLKTKQPEPGQEDSLLGNMHMGCVRWMPSMLWGKVCVLCTHSWHLALGIGHSCQLMCAHVRTGCEVTSTQCCGDKCGSEHCTHTPTSISEFKNVSMFSLQLSGPRFKPWQCGFRGSTHSGSHGCLLPKLGQTPSEVDTVALLPCFSSPHSGSQRHG
jgi:hypothetical protein